MKTPMMLVLTAGLLTGCIAPPAYDMAGVDARLAAIQSLAAQEFRAANARFDAALARTAVGMPVVDLLAVWGRPWQAINQVQAGGPPVQILGYCRHAQDLGICYRGRPPAIHMIVTAGILTGWTTY